MRFLNKGSLWTLWSAEGLIRHLNRRQARHLNRRQARHLGHRTPFHASSHRSCQSHLHCLRDESGSISPLIITYFLISLLVVFIGINITHSYLERRHLILAMESSLQRSVQVIDDWRYYTGYFQENTLRFRQRGMTTFVPIDCTAARRIFDEEFTAQWTLTRRLNPQDLPGERERALRNGQAGMGLWGSRGVDGDTGSPSGVESSSDSGSPSERRSPISDSGVAPGSRLPSDRLQASSIPTIQSFECDGRTVSATSELLVELPFQIKFAGVEFLRFSRQRVKVEAGLILGG